MDAAIAANAALGLMEPTGNGIGGDLFAIVWDPKTQKLYGYNGSGRSPKSLTLAEFQRRGLKDIPATGPLPVSVPGAVDGWFALHGRFGRKPMADNLAPAIRYAREGHPVAEVIAYYWDRSVPKLSQYPGFRSSSRSTATPRARARCGRTRTWPARCRRLPTVGATPSTRATSPAPSAITSRPMAAT